MPRLLGRTRSATALVEVGGVVTAGGHVGVGALEQIFETVGQRGPMVDITVGLVDNRAVREAAQGVGHSTMRIGRVGPRTPGHGIEELVEGFSLGHRRHLGLGP